MELLGVQENIREQLKKSKINFYKSPKERRTKAYVETRLQSIDAKWAEFTTNHYKLLHTEEISTSSYFEDGIYEEMEEFYIEFKSELREFLEKQFVQLSQECVTSDSNSMSTACGVKCNVFLPKLSIPTFSGRYTEFTSFRDLFISLVHNNSSLDDVQKLYYLKGHLTGEAEQLLRHIPITSGNYLQCWTTLENRYANKQFLANSILNDFFGQRKILTESAIAIKELLNNTLDMLNGMKSLEINVESWDILIIHIVSSKLDQESRKQWEAKVSELISQTNKLPDFKQFKQFLENRFFSLEFLNHNVDIYHHKTKGDVSKTITGPPKVITMLGTEIVCAYCRRNHKLSNCNDFYQIDWTQKRNFVKENKICFNCLRPNHPVKYCRSPINCQICSRRHHSLLHANIVNSKKGINDTDVDRMCNLNIMQNESPSLLPKPNLWRFSNNFSKEAMPHVLLPTALVTTESCEHHGQMIRALIDQGSQASFVTKAVAQRLKLKMMSLHGNRVAGLGHGNVIQPRGMVTFKLQSRINSGFEKTINAYVVDRITSHLPSSAVNISWPALKTLKLADPEYHLPNKVDMLLGAGVYGSIIRDSVIKSPSGTMIAQNTTLGWILSGEIR